MERGEELMELNRAASDRNTEAFERHARAFERLMTAFDRHERAFDRHERAFEQHEKAFEQHERTVEQQEETSKRIAAALDAHEARTDDLKVFIREMNLRSEKVVENLFRRGNEFMAEQAKRTDEIVAELRDGRAERKAHTDALLALVDRLPPAQAA
jgi:methyl-accepting chemotaxis protein